MNAGNREFKEFKEVKEKARDCTHVGLISALSRDSDEEIGPVQLNSLNSLISLNSLFLSQNVEEAKKWYTRRDSTTPQAGCVSNADRRSNRCTSIGGDNR